MREHMDITTLDKLREGECGVLCRINDEHSLNQRLTDLGWTEGTPVRCVRISPLGDPVAYGVRGAILALRRADSRGIAVCRTEART